MLSDESFQKLLFDLFCVWHDVRRHYDPPITHSEEEKVQKVKQMICKLLGEIDARVRRIIQEHANSAIAEQDFIEEWTMLTWNVLCITSRLQNSLQETVRSTEDRVIFAKLNGALVDLVNHTRTTTKPPPIFDVEGDGGRIYDLFTTRLEETMHSLHSLYRTLKSWPHANMSVASQQQQQQSVDVGEFMERLQRFASQQLVPFVDMFKAFCNEHSARLWQDVRRAQVARMINLQAMPTAPVERLVSFYSHMMYRLAILSARLQGFRHELTTMSALQPHMYGRDSDPVQALSDAVFSALELLMADCVLATEPSTNPILVTNNLFQINCGALARGVVFKQFDIQVIGEEQAEHVQSEMRSQRLLQRPTPIGGVPSAALLAMKPTSGVKRDARNQATQESQQGNKKSDVNSKEMVTIYPVFNAKNRYWAASYAHMLCTTRQKGGRSTNNSFQDLSPAGLGGALLDTKSSSGKRPIFYLHISATMFSPSGHFADAHTLSLPMTIATRRNQDCQVQRMMSSYTATCFWLYGCNVQEGLLLQWVDTGMRWDTFKLLFMQHFKVNAEVERGLQDRDFDLLQYKIQCNDCTAPGVASSACSSSSTLSLSAAGASSGEPTATDARLITFKNMLCPHLRYECGSTNVRFSVWRGMLEVLQLFQDSKTNVRKLWEKGLIMGFLEFEQVDAILAQHQSALIMRLSFVTGGTICISVKSLSHAGNAPMHLEPLDLKKLQAKCLKDYLRDICVAEKVKYIINADYEPIKITEVINVMFNEGKTGGGMEDEETSRKISSNVTHSGDIDAMQHITFTAMRIAVVTCKVKPPSADIWPSEEGVESPVLMGLNNTLDSKAHLYGGGSQALTQLPQQHHPYALYNSGSSSGNGSGYGLPAQLFQHDDFVREVIQLCRFHGKSKQELVELMERAPEDMFATLTLSSATSPAAPSSNSTNAGPPQQASGLDNFQSSLGQPHQHHHRHPSPHGGSLLQGTFYGDANQQHQLQQQQHEQGFVQVGGSRSTNPSVGLHSPGSEQPLQHDPLLAPTSSMRGAMGMGAGYSTGTSSMLHDTLGSNSSTLIYDVISEESQERHMDGGVERFYDIEAERGISGDVGDEEFRIDEH